MPLTALRDDSLVDATNFLDGRWQAVHRQTPSVKLRCRGCAQDLIAKESPLGLRFFAHWRRSPDCPTGSETLTHMELKTYLAAEIRRCGWEATVEAYPTDTDQGRWRADVMASRPGDRRRVAFEVQLSSMTKEDGLFRTERYARDGVEALWVTNAAPRWLFAIPGVSIDPGLPGLPRKNTAVAGAGKPLDGDISAFDTLAMPLDDVVRKFLSGDLVAQFVEGFVDHPRFYSKRAESSGVLLLSSDCAERVREFQAREAVRAEQLQSMLPLVLNQAREVADDVWLGAKAERAPKPDEYVECNFYTGTLKTSYGVPVFLGTDTGDLRLYAVLCPRVDTISKGLAQSWRRRGVRVLTAGAVQEDTSRALGYQAETLAASQVVGAKEQNDLILATQKELFLEAIEYAWTRCGPRDYVWLERDDPDDDSPVYRCDRATPEYVAEGITQRSWVSDEMISVGQEPNGRRVVAMVRPTRHNTIMRASYSNIRLFGAEPLPRTQVPNYA